MAREVTGYVVRWGVVDEYDTVFDRGAFASVEYPVPLLWGHQFSRVPLGWVLEGREDDTGYWVRAVIEDPNRGVISLIEEVGRIGASVGFLPRGWRIDEEDRIHFTEADLMELSLTPWPAVPGAEVEVSPGQDAREVIDTFVAGIRDLLAQTGR